MIFVHEGSGTLETIFGDVPYKDGDYLVIPRGTTYRFRPDGEQRYLVFETPGLIEIPRRYRNQYGQILEGAPYYHRDIHPPATLNTHDERGEFLVMVRVRGGYQDVRPRLPPVWTSSAGTATSTSGPSRSTTSSPSPGGSISRRPRTRRSRAGTRDLLVLPAQAGLRPARGADPVPPLEPAVGGDDLLRLRQPPARARGSTSARSRSIRPAFHTARSPASPKSRSA